VLGETSLPFLKLNLADHALSDPFAPPDKGRIEPKLWMAIPKLPGEEDLERAEIKHFGAHRQAELTNTVRKPSDSPVDTGKQE
jgi:hypothetical protein